MRPPIAPQLAARRRLDSLLAHLGAPAQLPVPSSLDRPQSSPSHTPSSPLQATVADSGVPSAEASKETPKQPVLAASEAPAAVAAATGADRQIALLVGLAPSIRLDRGHENAFKRTEYATADGISSLRLSPLCHL